MSRSLLSLLLVLAACLAGVGAGCVYHPSYEGTRCAADGACPSGYFCNNDVCVVESPPDGGQDGADGTDGADGIDGADEADGVDEALDGADAADGVDETPDGTDETPDGTDETPACGGPCPDGQFCDEVSNQCQHCEGSDHCGLACLPCDLGASETCQNLGSDGFCCLGPCDYAHACQQQDCDGTSFLCQALPPYDQPIVYEWRLLNTTEESIICALSDQDGMLPDHMCDLEGRQVLSWCPWYGKCDQAGACQPDQAFAARHECGGMFGCQDGRCRLHKQDGQVCHYNFDCESFCCSRDENAVCLPAASAEDQCKSRNARYFDVVTPRCFKAWDATDPHNTGAWSTEEDWGIDCAASCDHDRECDSGSCAYTVDHDRCWIDGCAGGNEGDIRDEYFCLTGDSAAHILSVTNQAVDPPTPPECVY